MGERLRGRDEDTRREVLGDEHVDRAAASGRAASALPWQEFITRYAWGGVWSRPGLDRRTRSAITLTALVSMRAENEIGMHVRAALRNGLTPEEIAEVFIHTAVYAGVPASNSAFAVARQAFSRRRHPPTHPRLPPSSETSPLFQEIGAVGAASDRLCARPILATPQDLGAVRAGDGDLRR